MSKLQEAKEALREASKLLKNQAKKLDRIAGDLDQGDLFSGTEDDIPASKPKQKDDDGELFQMLKTDFMTKYQWNKKLSYPFQAKDGKAIKGIIKKLKLAIKDHGENSEADNEYIKNLFGQVVMYILEGGDEWLKDNLTLNLLESKLTQTMAKMIEVNQLGGMNNSFAEELEELQKGSKKKL